MNLKRVRYCTTIIPVDRKKQFLVLSTWDKDDYKERLIEEEKHTGLHLIDESKRVFVVIEYTNIIWEYKIFYGSYKKKCKKLDNDEYWIEIEKRISFDLKIMGVEALTEKVINALKNEEYYEYKNIIDRQFKKYCV